MVGGCPVSFFCIARENRDRAAIVHKCFFCSHEAIFYENQDVAKSLLCEVMLCLKAANIIDDKSPLTASQVAPQIVHVTAVKKYWFVPKENDGHPNLAFRVSPLFLVFALCTQKPSRRYHHLLLKNKLLFLVTILVMINNSSLGFAQSLYPP